MNEFVWRTQDTDTWVAFKASLTLVAILGYIVITRFTAPRYWQEPKIEAQKQR
jgi:intracellular septation protein A